MANPVLSWRKHKLSRSYPGRLETNSFMRLTFGHQTRVRKGKYNTLSLLCSMHKPLPKDTHLFYSILLLTQQLSGLSLDHNTGLVSGTLRLDLCREWLRSRKTASRLRGPSFPLHYSRQSYHLTIMSPCRGKAPVRLWSWLSLFCPPFHCFALFCQFLLREDI